MGLNIGISLAALMWPAKWLYRSIPVILWVAGLGVETGLTPARTAAPPDCATSQIFATALRSWRPSAIADYGGRLPYLGDCQRNIVVCVAQRLTTLRENNNVPWFDNKDTR